MSKRKYIGDSIFVYAVSSSGDIYKNTLVFFKNTLQTPLACPPNENWHVAVHGLYANNATSVSDEYFVKISSSIIQPKFGSGNVLAVCSRPKPDVRTGRVIVFEPRNKEFFPLKSPFVSDIDIKLTNRNDELLTLNYGQPTLVILEFKRIEMYEREYIIRVDSQADPEGSATRFKTDLPPMISLDPTRKWNVTLSSIMYNGEFEQIMPYTHPSQKIIYVEYLDDAVNEMKYAKIELPFKRFKTRLEVFTAFQDVLNQVQYEGPSKVPFRLFKKLRMTPVTHKIKFEVAHATKLHFPAAWAGILGSTKAPGKGNRVHYTVQPGWEFEFEQSVNHNIWIPTYMLLYANFIDYTNIGSDVSVPVLKTIPLTHSESAAYYRHYEPPNPEFHRVRYSQLSNLEFWLSQSDGRPVQFVNPDHRVVLSLKFSEVKE